MEEQARELVGQMQEDEPFTCHGGNYLTYWAHQDVLVCEKCLDKAYNPETGEEVARIT